MEGRKETALQCFEEAVNHATLANDYVGLEDYNRNIANLKETTSPGPESTTPLSSPPSNPSTPSSSTPST
jgi:hypothetical protein